MNTAELQTSIQPEVVEKKRAAWANMGEAIYKEEMQLQAHAQAALLKIKMPTNIEEVQDAEATLKEIKAEQKLIETKRKTITSKFDEVAQRMMNPEKSLTGPINQLSTAIIAVKSEYEKLQRKAQARQEELKSLTEKIKSIVTNQDFEFKAKISTTVGAAYEYALGAGDVKPEDIKAFLAKCQKKLGVVDFHVEAPDSIVVNYLQPDEVTAIINEHYRNNPHAYVSMFHTELDKKFVDYAVAYSNKQQALELSKKEEAKKLAELESEKENKEVAAKLESASTTVEVSPGVKALKKSYEVDMVESAENAILILSAFVANIDKCMAKLRVTKWFAFTPAQAANALAKVKCDDNQFQPKGIIFKEVDKL